MRDPNKYTLHLPPKLFFQVLLLLNSHSCIRVLPGLLCLRFLAAPLASVGSLFGWRVVRAIIVSVNPYCLLSVNMAGRDKECGGAYHRFRLLPLLLLLLLLLLLVCGSRWLLTATEPGQ